MSACQHRPSPVVQVEPVLDGDALSTCLDCHAPLISVLLHVGDEDRIPEWGPWRAAAPA